MDTEGDNSDTSNKCFHTGIVLGKGLGYVACLVCLVMIALHGIKGIFHDVQLFIIFLFFFVVYISSFCYFDLLHPNPKKIILTAEDLENPSLFGFPVDNQRSSYRHIDVGLHGSLGDRQDARAAGNFTSPATFQGSPPPYHEAVNLPSVHTSVQIGRSETPPPDFEFVQASSSWNPEDKHDDSIKLA